MAKILYCMSQSLDGYVDLKMGPPGPEVFQHFVEQMGGVAGSLYGRNLYELMRYWEADQDGWDAPERAFAAAYRKVPKYVVSTTLKEVGPNATLVGPDLEGFVRKLKAEVDGTIEVAGPTLAGALTDLGLIDEYQLLFRPVVLGGSEPFFVGPRPPLRLVGSRQIGDSLLATYHPA